MIIIIIIIIIFQGLGLLACSGIRTYFSETYESIWTVGKTPWTGERPDVRHLLAQDNTTQRNADSHPCLPVFERPKTVRD
jgi:hypothetical protein